MDGRRFRTEAGGRVRKFLRHPHGLSDLSRKVLSLVTFFAPAKKVTHLQAKALKLLRLQGSNEPQIERSSGAAPNRQCFFARMPVGSLVSTVRLKVRSSPGRSAPTPTSWRATSSPRSLRIVSSIEYSVVAPSLG